MKLDQIPKKNPLNAPERYFDTLPGIVQSRIEAERTARQPQIYFRVALRYALPVLAFIAAGVFWFRSENSGQVEFETELASIDAQNLELFLENTEMNTDELMGTVAWSPEELEELEQSVYAPYGLPGTDLNELLDIYEIEPVKDSVR